MKIKTLIFLLSVTVIALFSVFMLPNLLEDSKVTIIHLDENFPVIFIRENPNMKGVHEVTTSTYLPECACDIETTYNMVFVSGDIPKAPANLRFIGRIINDIYYVDMVKNVL